MPAPNMLIYCMPGRQQRGTMLMTVLPLQTKHGKLRCSTISPPVMNRMCFSSLPQQPTQSLCLAVSFQSARSMRLILTWTWLRARACVKKTALSMPLMYAPSGKDCSSIPICLSVILLSCRQTGINLKRPFKFSAEMVLFLLPFH
ncbi:hypothetical protein SDC9_181386 [bioreactor metagenome]|uniref:Uncharacterized protein n=1 Tax=bioreactor metagenome TaxID=1076179 RepID=A0A645HCS2_9ZZZZ